MVNSDFDMAWFKVVIKTEGIIKRYQKNIRWQGEGSKAVGISKFVFS